MHADRPVELLGERGLVGRAEVAAPLERQALLLAGSSPASSYEMRGNGALTFSSFVVSRSSTFSSGCAPLEHAADDRDDQRLGQLHHVVERRRRPSRARPSRTRSGAGASSISRRGTSGRSSTPGRAPSRWLRCRAGRSASGTRSSSSKYCTGKSVVVPSHAAGVKIGVSARMKPRLVEEVADRVDHFVADAQDRLLPRRADPQVAAIHQEVDAVLLRRDRVVLRLGRRPRDAVTSTS